MLNVIKYTGFDTLPCTYDRLFAQASRHSFFMSLPWFQHFARTILSPDEVVHIYGIEESDKNQPVAALVMRRTPKDKRWFAPVRLESLANYYTSYFAPVVRDDYEAQGALAQAVVSALWKQKSQWDVMELRPLDNTSQMFTALLRACRETGLITQTYFCFGNWYLEVNGKSYSEYFQSLPSVLRKNIPYMTRKIKNAGHMRMEIHTEATSLDKACDDYTRVYNASWRHREAYPDFVRGLAQIAMENGWLRLGLLYLNDEPAAAQLWITHGEIASIYKICYDERFAKLSVGTVLTSHLMQYAIDVDKVKEIDYLSGDDEYKKNWMSHRRERWGILAFNPYRPKGLLQIVRHVLGRRIKNQLLHVKNTAPFVGRQKRQTV